MSNLIKRIETGYSPRPLQIYLHQAVARFNVICCHRRFGKTVFSLNEMIDRGFRNKHKNPQYAYVAPTYGQAKRIAWDYLKEFTRNIPGVVVNEAELRVDIPRPHMGDRIRFVLLGAENPNTIRGMYLDGVLLDEYAEMDPTIWSQVLRPALSDRKGWAIFIGTPKGQNHFYDIYRQAKEQMLGGNPDWFAAIYKASETGIVDKAELEAAAVTMTPEEYEQEFECSFTAALVGAYYGKEMALAESENRITKVPWQKQFPVHTFWDLGISDHMVIWMIQFAGKEFHVIDYIADTGKDLGYYAGELKKRPYTFGTHHLPHDAAVRELGTGRSRQEQLEELLGKKNIHVNPRQSVEDGISAVRMILNRCYFDLEKCKDGIHALKNYERKWDAKNKIYMAKPLHNWASHPADAFREFAMSFRDPQREQDRGKLPQRTNSNYNILNRRKRA